MKKYLFIPFFIFFFSLKAEAANEIYFEKEKIIVPVYADINDYLPKASCNINGQIIDERIVYEYGLDGTTLSIVNTSILGEYRVVCRATSYLFDLTCKTNIIFKVVDNEAPVIKWLDQITIKYGFLPIDKLELLEVTDNYDLNPIVSVPEFDLTKIGTSYCEVTATDSSGNTSKKRVRVVVEEKNIPVILCEDLFIDVHCNTSLMEGITVYDVPTDDVHTIMYDSNVDINQIGEYYADYSATDKSGNTSTRRRNIYVVDRKRPEIILKEDKIVKNNNETYDFQSNIEEIKDNYDSLENISINIEYEENDQGIFDVYYKIADSSNNLTIKKITVLNKDVISPIIEGENVYLKYGEKIDFSSLVKAYDNLEGDISHKVFITNNDYKEEIGTYNLTYEVYDLSGNYASKSIKVLVYEDEEHKPLVFPKESAEPKAQTVTETILEVKKEKKENYIPYFVIGGVFIAFIGYKGWLLVYKKRKGN